jgi:hypothetical protein
MPVSELHRRVAAVALSAAAGHGFALGGGNALLAHGMTRRPTQDVDLFTDQKHGVEAAADAVETALRGAGFSTQRRDKTAGLADIFPGMGEGLAEWIVSAPDGRQMMLQMAYFDRGCKPVIMDVGPVLDRVEPRDYADTAALLGRYTPDELIGFARRLDPGLTAQDFADAGRRLDRMDDAVLASAGLAARDVARVRQRFAGWPR